MTNKALMIRPHHTLIWRGLFLLSTLFFLHSTKIVAAENVEEKKSLLAWAEFRVRQLSTQSSTSCTEPQVSCTPTEENVLKLVKILSDADVRKRQTAGSKVIQVTSGKQFICAYREALARVVGSTCEPKIAMPDFLIVANDASTQLINQALQSCRQCQDNQLLKMVAAGSAISAKMYPEALRMLFDILEFRKDLRDVYESIQKTYALNQRGKGEVSLGSPH